MSEIDAYLWMFTAALIAGTFIPFLPASSELVLAGFLAAGQGETQLLVASATLGNVLGAVVNYVAGRYVSGLSDRPWFPVTQVQMDRASRLFNCYGFWVLLLTWLPFIGDVIAVVAGLLRTRFWLFLILTAIGKLFRYVAIATGFSIF